MNIVPPDSPLHLARSFYRIGKQYYDLGRNQDAAECFGYALKSVPHNPVMLYNLGAIYFEDRRYVDASSAFQRAVDLDQEFPLAYLSLGLCEKALGNKASAKSAFEEVTELPATYPGGAYYLSTAYHYLGKRKQALKAYCCALEQDPDYLSHFADLHRVLNHKGALDKAYDQYWSGSEKDRLLLRRQINQSELSVALQNMREYAGSYHVPIPKPRGVLAFLGSSLCTAAVLSPLLAITNNAGRASIFQFGQSQEQTLVVPRRPEPVEMLPSNPARIPAGPVEMLPSSPRTVPAAPLQPATNNYDTRPSPAPLRVEQTVAPRLPTPRTPLRNLVPEVVSRTPTGLNYTPPGKGVGPAYTPEQIPGYQSAEPINYAASPQDDGKRQTGGSGDKNTGGGANLRLAGMELDLSTYTQVTYNDNITTIESNEIDDFILTAGVDLSGELELSKVNTLSLGIGASVNKYLENDNLDSNNNFLTLSPDTKLALDMKLGQVMFTVYDQLEYSIDPSDARTVDPVTGQIQNDVSKFERFTNTLGVDMIWEQKTFDIAGKLRRVDVIPQQTRFDFADRTEYNGLLELTYKQLKDITLTPFIYAYTNDNETDLNANSVGGHTGLRAVWSASEFISVTAEGYLDYRDFDGVGLNQDSSEGVTPNWLISLEHTPTRNFTHKLKYLRKTTLGSVTNTTTSDIFSYEANYTGLKDIDLRSVLKYTISDDSGGFADEDYDQYGATLMATYNYSDQLSFSFEYDYKLKDSKLQGGSYTQNLVTLGLRYDF